MDKTLNITFENSIVNIKVRLKEADKYTFAFYIFLNDTPIIKTNYENNSEYSYQLNENGIYSFTVFIKDKENMKNIISSTKYRWIKNFKEQEYIRIEEIELTNNCNLNCKNCCTPTSKYPKGYLDDQTFLLALSWMQEGQTVNYHRIGEPLLHPKVCEYVHWGCSIGKIKPVISTNGILLTEKMLDALIKNGLRRLVITLHTKKSVESYKMCIDYFEKNHIKVLPFEEMFTNISNNDDETIFFSGKILDFNAKKNRQWFCELEITNSRYTSLLQFKDSHTWAGNVSDTRKNFQMNSNKNREKCYFIKRKVVNMRWDGTIVGCCFDSENDNEIGNIRDFFNLNMDINKYNLCQFCDSNWAVQD